MATDSKRTFLNKFELWTKFMQSGKTKEMTDEIKKLAETAGDYFHIIFCSNNLFLTNQTQKRVSKTMEYDIDETMVPFLTDKLKSIVYASSNKECRKYQQLVQQFDDYRAILCCTNKTRFEDIEKLLIEQFDDNRKVIVWIDEIHMNYNMTLEYLLRISPLICIKKIVGISATPDIIFKNKEIKQNDKITLKPMKACNATVYYGFNDINKIIIDIDDYVMSKDVKKNNNTENALYLNTLLVNKNITYTDLDVVYVPGNRYKISHEAIRDVLLSHGFYVFIFNDSGSYLYKTPDERIDIGSNGKNTTHLGQLMGNIRDTENLTNKPIGITGYGSIGQGNTLCDFDTNFYITKSVIGYKSALQSNGGYNAFITQVFGQCFMRSKFAEDIEQCILSGGLSQFALETGTKRINYDELADIKETLKEMFIDDDAKNDTSENKENENETIPIPFTIVVRSVFDELRNNALNKNKKNVEKTLKAYLTSNQYKKETSDNKEIIGKIEEDGYKIDKNHIYWITDPNDSNSKNMRIFEEIYDIAAQNEKDLYYSRNDEQKILKYPIPDEIKNRNRKLWIIMDLRGVEDDARCFALCS